MSQPFSRFLHPFDIKPHPSLEPEVRQAILASWAAEQQAATGPQLAAITQGNRQLGTR